MLRTDKQPKRKAKIFYLMLIDLLLIFFANGLSFLFVQPYVTLTVDVLFFDTIAQAVMYLFFAWHFKVFKRINRYIRIKELVSIFFAVAISSILEISTYIIFQKNISKRFIILSFLFTLLFIVSSRIMWLFVTDYRISKNKQRESHIKKTIVIGAGSGSETLLSSLLRADSHNQLKVIGLVDDDPDKVGTYFLGLEILGTTNDLPTILEENQIEMIVVAIPSLSPNNYERILDIVNPLGVPITSMPSIEEIADGSVSVSKLREIDVVDLLGREEVNLDITQISQQISGKVILVTGAGGSIGSEICRQILPFGPKKILLLGHGENSIYLILKELENKFGNTGTEIIPIIGDIQDKLRLEQIFAEYRPAIIYHAAAHKHVPLMEYNPLEAIKNNIFGTKNVAETAKEFSAESFVMISTDKAVNPPNIMGATKRIAEMIVTGLNETGKTKFSAVRFGNVLGSRGSVIPLFKEQIANGGPITITDFRMTRYFMTIPEASKLVIQSGALANGGEIFILDMGQPVKIVDLAKKMIKLSGYTEKDIQIEESGIRPGEKLYEELLVTKERADQQVHEKIFVGKVKGFSLEEIVRFMNDLPDNEEEIKESIIRYANESSSL